MKPKLHINSTLEDLRLIDVSLDFSNDLLQIYSIFEEDKHIPGVCLYNSNAFTGLISRKKFFEIMSKQFMYDLYSKRKIEYFFSKDMSNSQLVIGASTKVVDALHMALARNDDDIYEPIVVFSYPDKYRILDFYDLVLAQNEILNVMNSLLKEANDFKNEVLAIVAHDLRNPLGAIRGFSGLITESKENNAQCKFYAETICNAAIHMEELVSKFLLSAINDSTEMQLHNSCFNIKEAIESVIINLNHLAKAKNQMIRFNVELLDCDVYSDKLKISEVIENLVSNALKYSNSGTQVEITLKKETSYIQIAIKDEGPGFSDTDQQHLFGKFQRLSARPTGNESSTGLGLFTVKKIMDIINGKISLITQPGKGSEFIIQIPDLSAPNLA